MTGTHARIALMSIIVFFVLFLPSSMITFRFPHITSNYTNNLSSRTEDNAFDEHFQQQELIASEVNDFKEVPFMGFISNAEGPYSSDIYYYFTTADSSIAFRLSGLTLSKTSESSPDEISFAVVFTGAN